MDPGAPRLDEGRAGPRQHERARDGTGFAGGFTSMSAVAFLFVQSSLVAPTIWPAMILAAHFVLGVAVLVERVTDPAHPTERGQLSLENGPLLLLFGDVAKDDDNSLVGGAVPERRARSRQAWSRSSTSIKGGQYQRGARPRRSRPSTVIPRTSRASVTA